MDCISQSSFTTYAIQVWDNTVFNNILAIIIAQIYLSIYKAFRTFLF